MAKSVKMFTKMMQTTTSAHRWLQDSKVVKSYVQHECCRAVLRLTPTTLHSAGHIYSYVKILGKPPASRTVRDVQRLCVFFQEVRLGITRRALPKMVSLPMLTASCFVVVVLETEPAFVL